MAGKLNLETKHGVISKYDSWNRDYGKGLICTEEITLPFASTCFYGTSQDPYPRVGLNVDVSISLSTGEIVFVFATTSGKK